MRGDYPNYIWRLYNASLSVGVSECMRGSLGVYSDDRRVDDVTKPVRERVRMRAVEIDDVVAIDYTREGWW